MWLGGGHPLTPGVLTQLLCHPQPSPVCRYWAQETTEAISFMASFSSFPAFRSTVNASGRCTWMLASHRQLEFTNEDVYKDIYGSRGLHQDA